MDTGFGFPNAYVVSLVVRPAVRSVSASSAMRRLSHGAGRLASPTRGCLSSARLALSTASSLSTRPRPSAASSSGAAERATERAADDELLHDACSPSFSFVHLAARGRSRLLAQPQRALTSTVVSARHGEISISHVALLSDVGSLGVTAASRHGLLGVVRGLAVSCVAHCDAAARSSS